MKKMKMITGIIAITEDGDVVRTVDPTSSSIKESWDKENFYLSENGERVSVSFYRPDHEIEAAILSLNPLGVSENTSSTLYLGTVEDFERKYGRLPRTFTLIANGATPTQLAWINNLLLGNVISGGNTAEMYSSTYTVGPFINVIYV